MLSSSGTVFIVSNMHMGIRGGVSGSSPNDDNLLYWN